MVNVSWVAIYVLALCVNTGFYMIGQHLTTVGDPLASSFITETPTIYDVGQEYNKTQLVGNITNIGNYTSGGTGSPFDIFEQATEAVIGGGYTIWQGMTLGFVFKVISNTFNTIGVSLPYLQSGLSDIFGLAFILFVGYMIFGRKDS